MLVTVLDFLNIFFVWFQRIVFPYEQIYLETLDIKKIAG